MQGDAGLDRCRAFMAVSCPLQSVQRAEFWGAILALQAFWPGHLGTDDLNCESGCAYHGITDCVTNTLMKVQHVAVSENSVQNSCVPCTVIWTWRFVLSRQT